MTITRMKVTFSVVKFSHSHLDGLTVCVHAVYVIYWTSFEDICFGRLPNSVCVGRLSGLSSLREVAPDARVGRHNIVMAIIMMTLCCKVMNRMGNVVDSLNEVSIVKIEFC